MRSALDLANDFNAASQTSIDSFRNILDARTLTYSSTPGLYRCIIYVVLETTPFPNFPRIIRHFHTSSIIKTHGYCNRLRMLGRAKGCKTFEMIRNGHRNAAV